MITTAKEFRKAQKQAAELCHKGREDVAIWPSDKDLVRVLKNHKGPVHVEVIAKNSLYQVQVVKSDLIEQITNPDEPNQMCQFSILHHVMFGLILTPNHYI